MWLSNLHRFVLLFVVVALPQSVQSAQLKYYYEMVDRQALPADVVDFIERENNCYTLDDQAMLPRGLDADQSEVRRKERCEELPCMRRALFDKYFDTPLRDVIHYYNSSLWNYDFDARYDGQPNDPESCKKS
ncbi:MAG TPA: hypothetical protein DIS76_04105 [Rhodospirillaceae bacterium]|nr:hypothetical protein [Rhodospirillaceae bacterium]